jgi:hypothetical protein
VRFSCARFSSLALNSFTGKDPCRRGYVIDIPDAACACSSNLLPYGVAWPDALPWTRLVLGTQWGHPRWETRAGGDLCWGSCLGRLAAGDERSVDACNQRLLCTRAWRMAFPVVRSINLRLHDPVVGRSPFRTVSTYRAAVPAFGVVSRSQAGAARLVPVCIVANDTNARHFVQAIKFLAKTRCRQCHLACRDPETVLHALSISDHVGVQHETLVHSSRTQLRPALWHAPHAWRARDLTGPPLRQFSLQSVLRSSGCHSAIFPSCKLCER